MAGWKYRAESEVAIDTTEEAKFLALGMANIIIR